MGNTSTTGTCGSWAKETKFSLCAAGKRTDGANIHTRKFTGFYNTRLLPHLCWRGLWLELVILDSPLKSPGKGVQQVRRSWGGTGDEPQGSQGATHELSPQTQTHQCFSPVHWALPCTSPELLQTPRSCLLAPAWPPRHKQQPRTHRCFI